MINLTKKDFIAMKKNEFVTNESHMCIDPNNKNKIIKIIKKFKNEPEFFKMKMYIKSFKCCYTRRNRIYRRIRMWISS